jgi:hypothetical protein
MSEPKSTTKFTPPNNPFYVEVRYHTASPYFLFCATTDEAIATRDLIVQAINDSKHMVSVNANVDISVDNVRSVVIVEKGTQIDDVKWMG